MPCRVPVGPPCSQGNRGSQRRSQRFSQRHLQAQVLVSMDRRAGYVTGVQLPRQLLTHPLRAREDQTLSNGTSATLPGPVSKLPYITECSTFHSTVCAWSPCHVCAFVHQSCFLQQLQDSSFLLRTLNKSNLLSDILHQGAHWALLERCHDR